MNKSLLKKAKSTYHELSQLCQCTNASIVEPNQIPASKQFINPNSLMMDLNEKKGLNILTDVGKRKLTLKTSFESAISSLAGIRQQKERESIGSSSTKCDPSNKRFSVIKSFSFRSVGKLIQSDSMSSTSSNSSTSSSGTIQIFPGSCTKPGFDISKLRTKSGKHLLTVKPAISWDTSEEKTNVAIFNVSVSDGVETSMTTTTIPQNRLSFDTIPTVNIAASTKTIQSCSNSISHRQGPITTHYAVSNASDSVDSNGPTASKNCVNDLKVLKIRFLLTFL